MPDIDRLLPQPDARFAFFQGFLNNPREVGSIIPSSRFLERRIVRSAGIEKARTIVELGPGTGGTTRALLRAMSADANLLSVELNPRFVNLLRREPDPRFHVWQGSAADIKKALQEHDLPSPDVVLSGIPFSTMPRELGMEILYSVRESLAPDGRFVAYQVRDRVEILGRQVFGPARVQTEILNVPPMRVYRWIK
jgi:phosphatidylethanolamine/phosphatidyl-N-methylethanolamine N-methyltransferase